MIKEIDIRFNVNINTGITEFNNNEISLITELDLFVYKRKSIGDIQITDNNTDNDIIANIYKRNNEYLIEVGLYNHYLCDSFNSVIEYLVEYFERKFYYREIKLNKILNE